MKLTYEQEKELGKLNALKIKAAAKILGAKFKECSDWSAGIEFDGFRVWSRTQTDKLSFMVSVPNANKVYLRDSEKADLTLEIGVSAKKEPDAIARDIQKRLLPSAIKYAALIKVQTDSNNEYLNAMQSMRDRSGKALGLKHIPGKADETQELSGYTPGNVHVSIRASRETIMLTIDSLDIDQVYAIAAILNKGGKK